MLISHKHKFIFTKTVKTAGTSVELLLEPFCTGEGHRVQATTPALESAVGIVGARGAPADLSSETWYNHMPAAAIKAQLGEAIWAAYCKFTVVRNPYDKMVSWFHFRHLRKKDCADLGFEEIKARFRRFLLDGDFSRALDRDKYTIDGQICVDRFLRYETLEDDLSALAADLGLNLAGRKLPRAKGRFRPQGHRYQDYYDDVSAAAVSRAFAYELKAFDYSL